MSFKGSFFLPLGTTTPKNLQILKSQAIRPAGDVLFLRLSRESRG
jgi:hypothetical protein